VDRRYRPSIPVTGYNEKYKSQDIALNDVKTVTDWVGIHKVNNTTCCNRFNACARLFIKLLPKQLINFLYLLKIDGNVLSITSVATLLTLVLVVVETLKQFDLYGRSIFQFLMPGHVPMHRANCWHMYMVRYIFSARATIQHVIAK
jgi:hypothetical protein